MVFRIARIFNLLSNYVPSSDGLFCTASWQFCRCQSSNLISSDSFWRKSPQVLSHLKRCWPQSSFTTSFWHYQSIVIDHVFHVFLPRQQCEQIRAKTYDVIVVQNSPDIHQYEIATSKLNRNTDSKFHSSSISFTGESTRHVYRLFLWSLVLCCASLIP